MLKAIPVEVYSRVCGYYRPVNQWNKGKKEEFKERKVAVTQIQVPMMLEKEVGKWKLMI